MTEAQSGPRDTVTKTWAIGSGEWCRQFIAPVIGCDCFCGLCFRGMRCGCYNPECVTRPLRPVRALIKKRAARHRKDGMGTDETRTR